jgi:RNA polymerase sigma factor (sigma-70 family)
MIDANATVRQYSRLAFSIARSYGHIWVDAAYHADIDQAALIGTWKAAQTWDPERSSLGFWVFVCARTAVRDEVRRLSRHGFIYKAGRGSRAFVPKPTASLEAMEEIDALPPSACCDPWAALEEHETTLTTAGVLAEALDRLPDRWRGVVLARVEGETAAATASRLGVSHQRVSQIFAEARARVLAEVHP